MKRIILAGFLLISLNLFSQTDYTWWTQLHHWDGITPWYYYLKFSPVYFGPNALPVPEVSKGIVGEKGTVELATEAYFSKGDKTQDLFTKLYYPVVPHLIAIEGYVVPVEHFKMDTATRDIRAARDKSGEGTAGGDIYFATILQLVRNKKFPDMTLRISLRTASGTNVSAARYTDAPGYFFDLSFGKDYRHDKLFFDKIRPYAMAGFYSWQTNSGDHRQDDAILFGAGVEISSEKLIVTASAGGYAGYIKNGDSPAVVRLNVFTKGRHFNYGISLQSGIHDYPYQSVKLSVVYNLPEVLMLKSGLKAGEAIK